MAAAIGSHGVARFGGDRLPKPSAVVMAYTGHSEYSANEPPTFVVVGERDEIAPPSVMERRVLALRKLGTEVAFHRCRDLGHGFGPGIGTTADGWLDRAVRFWEKASGRTRGAGHEHHSHIFAAQRPTRGCGGRRGMSRPRMTVLVIGATGSIGRLVVEEGSARATPFAPSSAIPEKRAD
jgi:hypothetical protein